MQLVHNFEDSLKVGDYITVVRWKSLRDNSYCGDVLRVVAIDKPYLVVCCMHGALRGHNISLSLDMVEVKPLTDAYVAALHEPKQI